MKAQSQCAEHSPVFGNSAEHSGQAKPHAYSIAGLVVHTKPENRVDVSGRLALLAGVEVHAIGDDGKLVVTVEELDPSIRVADVVTDINNIQGVINASLVYSHTDSEAAEILDSEEQR